MDNNLGKYYKEMNDTTYFEGDDSIGKFKAWCISDGLDAETVKEELKEDATECILCDFDHDFPFKNDISLRGINESEYIYKILKASTKRNMDLENITVLTDYDQFGDDNLDSTDDNIISMINLNLALYYKSIGDGTYYKDDEDDADDDDSHELDDKTDGKFMFWCRENDYDEKMVYHELENNDPENCKLCLFDDNFPLKMHIHDRKQRLYQIYNILRKCRSREDINRYLDEYQAVFRVLPNLAPHEVADHIGDALEAIQFNFINHKYKDEMLQKLFERKLKKLDLQIGSHELLNDFVKELESIGISSKIATDIFFEILPEEETKIESEIIADKKEIIEKIMTALKEQSNEFQYLTIDVTEYKRVFCSMFKEKLDKFYAPISKLRGARKQDFIDIAKKIDIFNDDKGTVNKLCDYLFDKLFYDIEHIKPWSCNHCNFLNRKMMVGGLWRLYNQLNECGLCGQSRYSQNHTNSKESNVTNNKNTEFVNSDPLLSEHIGELEEDWLSVATTKCHYKKGVEFEQIYLDRCDENDIISLIEYCINKFAVRLNDNKYDIIEWCCNKNINGSKLIEMKRKGFINNVSEYTKNKKLKAPLGKLYDELMNYDINCGSLKRICVILEHFHKITDDLSDSHGRYPYEIKKFLSALKLENKENEYYSPIKLLDDIDHILYKHPNTVQLQPYIKCSASTNCPYSDKATRQNDTYKTFKDKQEYFHCDNWKDYVYISTLSKIHTAILHPSRLSTIQNDAATIKKYTQYPVYSTGVFIQYQATKPLHINLRKELTQNRASSISEQEFENALVEVKLLMQTTKWKEEESKWKAYKTNELYGVTVGDSLSIENVLVLHLYCGNTGLCRSFRSSYRCTDDNIETARKYHNNNYYWFGRFIYTSIHFFGKAPKSNKTFYHGLDGQFLFNEFSTIFEAPTSTTIEFDVAKNAFGNNGIVLTLAPKYKNELNISKCLDVSTISSYEEEKERLFAGMTVLAIIDIGYAYNNKWHVLTDWFKVFLYFERIIEQTIHQRDFYNYGVIPDDDKEERKRFIKLQQTHLVPMIKHQMDRNIVNNKDIHNIDASKHYLYALFEHFCDSKRDYINLTCIKKEKELENMHPSLQSILFDKNNEINKKNIKLIFPNLKQFKNNMGYWIKLNVEETNKKGGMVVFVEHTELKYDDKDDNEMNYEYSPIITQYPSTLSLSANQKQLTRAFSIRGSKLNIL